MLLHRRESRARSGLMPEKVGFSRLKLVRREDMPPPPVDARRLMSSLGVASPFSFLRGASDAIELVLAALELGMDAIGIADRNTLAGVVRMHSACKGAGLRPLIGCRLDLTRCAEPARLPDRPRRLWPAVAAAQPRQDARGERRVRAVAARRRGPCRRHRLHRLAGGRSRRFRSRAAAASRRLDVTPPCRGELALSRRRRGADRAARPARAGATAARSSPPTTSIIMRPTAGRCRTSSPASARR